MRGINPFDGVGGLAKGLSHDHFAVKGIAVKIQSVLTLAIKTKVGIKSFHITPANVFDKNAWRYCNIFLIDQLWKFYVHSDQGAEHLLAISILNRYWHFFVSRHGPINLARKTTFP